MSILSAITGGAKSMVMGVEQFFDQLEPEIANDAAPYLAKIRSGFVDEMGYLGTTALADIKTLIQTAIKANLAQLGSDPAGFIATVTKSVASQLPGTLSVLEQLALHGLVSFAVSAIV